VELFAELSGTWGGGTLGCFIPYKEIIKQICVVESRILMKSPQALAAPMSPDFCLRTLNFFFSRCLFFVVARCKGQNVSQRVMRLESGNGFNSDSGSFL